MKTTFKLSLLALAFATAAHAGDVTVTSGGKKFGYEGLTTTTGSNVNVTLGANSTTAPTFTIATAVPVDGLIRVTFSVPFTTGSAAPSFANLTNGANGNIFANGTAVLQVANSGANYVVYRVATAALSVGDTISIPTAKFVTRELASAGVLNITVTTENATGTLIDSVEDAELAKVHKVRAFAVDTKAAGTIDVSKGRTVLNDVTALTTKNDLTVVNAFNVNYASLKGSIAGDFSWVKDTDADTAGIQAATGLFAIGDCGAPSKVTATALEFSCTGDKKVGLTVDLDKNTEAKPDAGVASVLKATKFTITSESDFSNALGLASNKVKVFDAADGGEWKLNGSNVLVPYMVYGTVGGKAYNQVIQLTNNSSVEGAIYVDITDGEGKSIAKNSKLTVAAKPNSVTNIGSEIKALVAAAKYEGKVSIRVVAEIPSASTEVYAAYQDVATSERAIVVGLTTQAN